MGWLRFLRRERRDRDFALELEAHLAHEMDDLMERGMSPANARYAALRKLGNLTALRETIHERNSLVALESVWADLRHGARQMRRSPGFTLVAVLSLALGIGANTAIFSLLKQLLLRSLPVRDPHELVYLYHPGPLEGNISSDEEGDPSFSYPLFRALQEQQTSFTGLAGARSASADLSYRNQPAVGQLHRVSGNYFKVLRVGASLGRVLSEDDDRVPGGRPVAVLSHRYWSSRLGGDVSVLNQTLLVNGYPMTIVGVADKTFEGEYRRWAMDVFVPITMNRELVAGWNGFDDRQDHWVTLAARRRPGVSREQAEAAINVVYRAQLEEDIQRFGWTDKEFLERYRAKRIVAKEGQLGRGGSGSETRLVLSVLMGITLLVLLICCTNVANLLLARGAARARELSARQALGASRLRLVRQLLAEAVLLGLAGAALGLLVARWTLEALLSVIPTRRAAGPLSSELDGAVLLYCVGLSLASVLVFGLAPALRSSRLDLVTALKDQSAQMGGPHPGLVLGRSLVTGQLAVSLVLLTVAGLFAKTFVNLTRMDLGIRPDNLLTFSLQANPNRYSTNQAAHLYDQIRERLAAVPGVTSVSFAQVPAIAGSSSSTKITVGGFVPSDDEASRCYYNEVGPSYFRTLGIPLVVGREFSDADAVDTPRVAVVNEAFVRHFLPRGNPLGQRFARGTGDVVPDVEIVGVVKDAKYSSMREPPLRIFYMASRQAPGGTGRYFYIRTATETGSLLGSVRTAVGALAPDHPVRKLKTMQQQLEENIAGERLLSGLTGTFGVLATLLASIGLYGVLSYNVARRTREIGIRIALGADAARVRGMLVREVVITLLTGTALGAAAAIGVGTLLQSLLYGMKPLDPTVYASTIAILAFVALAAAYGPARRASRVDPMLALRHE